jgi:hypothetical protein
MPRWLKKSDPGATASPATPLPAETPDPGAPRDAMTDNGRRNEMGNASRTPRVTAAVPPQAKSVSAGPRREMATGLTRSVTATVSRMRSVTATVSRMRSAMAIVSRTVSVMVSAAPT